MVIPTLGRPSLGRLLQSLFSSRGPLPDAVFVVDDRRAPVSPLALPALPPEWDSRVIVLRGSSRGPAAARNAGWRASSAAWIAFLDDDVVAGADWLDLLQQDLETLGAEVAGSQGRIKVPLPQDRRPTDWERNVAGLEAGTWITADMAFRREALHAVGGFDERFPRAYREDADLALRLQKAGYELLRGRREVAHPVGFSEFMTSVKLQAGNADDALMKKVHGRRWRALARAGPARMPVHAATTLALAASVLGSGRSRSAALAGWAALTGHFAWRRIAPGPKTRDEVLKMIVTSALIPPAAVLHRIKGEVSVRRTRKLEPGPSGPEPLIRAVLFDRDGTLVEDVPYNGDPQKVEPKPGAAEALRRLREAGIATGVISNQSGVARGLLTTADVQSVNARIEEILGPLGPWVICEHGPGDGCKCRKPAPGMIIEAARRLGVEPHECVVVGDIGADVEAALRAGAAPILVPGPVTLPEEIAAAPVVARHLPQAVDVILARARPARPPA